MREMKESGIAWLQCIPSHWDLNKIKYTLQERKEDNNPIKTKDILSLTAKQGVIPLEEKEGGGNKPKEDYSAYRLAYPGDIVMNSMNILSGSVGLSKYFGCVSPVYYMLRPQNENDDVRYDCFDSLNISSIIGINVLHLISNWVSLLSIAR